MPESTFDLDLLKLVLARLPREVDPLTEVLQWRGFLVEQQGPVCCLHRGAHRSDVEALQEWGFELRSPPANDDEFMAELRLSSGKDHLETLERIFLASGVGARGMSGPFDFYNATWMSKSLWSFLSTRFGANAPVLALDPGVALWVKVMPGIGARTVYSCDGHRATAPAVSFWTPYDLEWVKLVFTSVFRDTQHVHNWVFEYDGRSWMDCRWIWLGGSQDAESRYRLFSDILDVTRILLNRRVRETIRGIRGRLPNSPDWAGIAASELAQVDWDSLR